jgi:hypothetical protein
MAEVSFNFSELSITAKRQKTAQAYVPLKKVTGDSLLHFSIQPPP